MVDAAEVHLRAALADGQLDGPPAEQVHDPGMGVADARGIGRVDRRQAIAVAIQEQAAEHVGRRRAPRGTRPARRRGRARHQCEERVARPEREALALAGPLEQGRERPEGLVERTVRAVEQRVAPVPAGRVVAPDDDPGALRRVDALAGRLREPRADRRVVRVGGEGQADPVARRLDLRDRRGSRRRAGPRRRPDVAAGISASVAMTSTPVAPRCSARAARRAPMRRARLVRVDDRATRSRTRCRRRSTGSGGPGRPRRARRRASRSAVASPRVSQCRRPGPRLVDVAARAVDHAPIPGLELGRLGGARRERVGGHQSAPW